MDHIPIPASQENDTKWPILYSFRRCPYAMRARLALMKSGITVCLREVELKNKPDEMLDASPKGSVPVLVLQNGTVIDESFDIMMWALSENDPDNWLAPGREEIDDMVARNDTSFKAALDRYKYPNRYPDEDCSWARDACLETFRELNSRIAANGGFLAGSAITAIDIAIFPFIRQAAFTDKEWFDGQDIPALQNWLTLRIESPLFKTCMIKSPPWASGQTPVFLTGHSQLAA